MYVHIYRYIDPRGKIPDVVSILVGTTTSIYIYMYTHIFVYINMNIHVYSHL